MSLLTLGFFLWPSVFGLTQTPQPTVMPSPTASAVSTPPPPVIHIHWVRGNELFKTENPNHRASIQELLEKGETPQLEVLRGLMKSLPQSDRFTQAVRALSSNSWTRGLRLSFHYDDIDPFETQAPGKLWFVAEPAYIGGQDIPKKLPVIYQVKIWKNLKDSQSEIEGKLDTGATWVADLEKRKQGAQEIISKLPFDDSVSASPVVGGQK